MGAEWDEALTSPVPVLISVRTGSEVPPLPPHITFEEATQFMHALQQIDPHQPHLLRDATAQLLATVTGKHGT